MADSVPLSPHGRDEAVKRWTTRDGIPIDGEYVSAAAFDAVVAERDEAIRQREQAATTRNVIAEQRDQALDRLTKWERGVWPSTEAQHGVLLDQIKELVAERDAAIAAGQKLADAVARVCGEGHPALAAWRALPGCCDRPVPETEV